MNKNILKYIDVKGAREHNLKNIDVRIPKNKITVITGLSGSGKSSLAFDTIYAEGQRRYMDGLSAYAKQFLDQLKKPDVDSISGLTPSISIEQKVSSTNVRSTVGTVTEIYDLLRILYSKLGVAHCPDHPEEELKAQGTEKIVDQIMSLPEGSKLIIYAPVARQKKGEFLKEFKAWFKKGFLKARVNGNVIDLDTAEKLQKTKMHNIDLVVDRVILKSESRHRISQAVERANQFGNSQIILFDMGSNTETLYSTSSACSKCGFSFPDFSDPKFFSFNSQRGYCPTCKGIGTVDIDEDGDSYNVVYDDNIESAGDIDELSVKACHDCGGSRLRLEARNVFLGQKTISDFSLEPIADLIDELEKIPFNDNEKKVAGKLLEELVQRLSYLEKMGVGYLHLNRPSRTLSGGESQRIRLASQIGSGLVGVLYVLDEPSIGLHPQDHSNLLEILNELKDKGNTILMVEHDEETIRSADYIFDLGPGAGRLGGNIQAKGNLQDIIGSETSVTGKFLSGKKTAAVIKDKKIETVEHFIELTGASEHNLKSVNLKLPLNQYVVVTGVSGSGKSTLIIDTLYKLLAKHFYSTDWVAGKNTGITGMDNVDRIVNINQKPIGRTPRSNPATYVGMFTEVRQIFTELPEAKIRGFKPGHFSFNVKGGRCEECNGAGKRKLEMNFMANVYVECEYCLGKRYTRDTLNIKYKDKSISDILDMTVEEAYEFFKNHKKLERQLRTLLDVGLDYITLGQAATTLSGGEAQRIKLSKELSKRSFKKALYILDEPTTGLHFEDIRKLNSLLQRLVDAGNSVVVIEHNLDIIRSADHIIELGPQGGKYGGKIVFTGSLEELKKANTATSKFI
ncbi:MAG: excinuclease ABC subunit UvrA [Bdellovibrionota bacterium]|nr:excinuclease ABC subunit UvrA [Bdellovibrionota bacterium]